MLLGLAYGLCLVSGLRQAEHLANPAERGAVIAAPLHALAYLGFAVPYLVDGLDVLAWKTRCVHRADRDHRGARALDRGICGQPALGRP